MTTNRLDKAGLNSTPQKETLRFNVPELERQFYRTREHLGIKFKLGHELREKNLTKCITSLLSGERKKKKMRSTIVSKQQIHVFKLHSTRAIISCPSDF